MSVSIALAVRAVVLVVVGYEVVQREAVMRGNEIDRSKRFTPTPVEQIGGGRDAGGEFRENAFIALPIRPHRIAITVVPFCPTRRKMPDLIAARTAVPWLGNQLDLIEHRVLPAGVEKPPAFVEAMRF